MALRSHLKGHFICPNKITRRNERENTKVKIGKTLRGLNLELWPRGKDFNLNTGFYLISSGYARVTEFAKVEFQKQVTEERSCLDLCRKSTQSRGESRASSLSS